MRSQSQSLGRSFGLELVLMNFPSVHRLHLLVLWQMSMDFAAGQLISQEFGYDWDR